MPPSPSPASLAPLAPLVPLALGALFLLSSSSASAVPPLPRPTWPAEAPPAAASPAPSAEPADKLRRGIVAIELNGRPVSVGTVLANDGRVLTSLSGLGGAPQAQLRYADGTTVLAKVVHTETDWDLALLAPQAGKWKDGLTASEVDPQATELRLMLPTRGKLGPVAVGFKGRTDAKSREGTPLLNTLDLDLKGALPVAGAPVIDDKGSAVGLLIRACQVRSTAPCAAMVVGAPVSAIRSFLMRTPATAVAPPPWLGIRGASAQAGSVKGVRVLDVGAQSPAQKAGLRGGPDPQASDMIIAVDGAPVETPEQLAALVARKAVGDSVKLLVFDGSKFREVPVTLRTAP